MQTGTGIEAARNQTIAQLLGVPESAARTRLLGAQAEYERVRPDLQQRIAEINNAKTPEEINKIKAETKQANAAGQLSETRTREINSLLDQKVEAERLGNQKLIQELNSQIQQLFVGERVNPETGQVEQFLQPGLLNTGDILRSLTAKATAGGAGELAERKYAEQQTQTAVDIEKIILDKPKSPEALARYEDYNRFSDRPRLAVKSGSKVEFIPLHKVKGRQVTAKQVYEAANELGLTVDEVYKIATENKMDILSFFKVITDAQRQTLINRAQGVK